MSHVAAFTDKPPDEFDRSTLVAACRLMGIDAKRLFQFCGIVQAQKAVGHHLLTFDPATLEFRGEVCVTDPPDDKLTLVLHAMGEQIMNSKLLHLATPEQIEVVRRRALDAGFLPVELENVESPR